MNSVIKAIGKKYGDSIITEENKIPGYIPTGSINLDLAIGVPGWPKQKLTEFFGPPGSGKTTICMESAIMTQKLGQECVYIDAECKFNFEYAASLGIDTKNGGFTVFQPETAEDGINIILDTMRVPEVGLIILDSVPSMVPSKEAIDEGDTGDAHIGLYARLMTQFCRRVTPILRHSNAAIVMINQVRANIGANKYAEMKTPGGAALYHAVVLRVQIGRKGFITDKKKNVVGIVSKTTTQKNQLSSPRKTAEFNIYFGEGIDNSDEMVQLLVSQGIIKKSGAWYKDQNDQQIGQGATSVYNWINNNMDVVKQSLENGGVNPIYANNFNGTDRVGEVQESSDE